MIQELSAVVGYNYALLLMGFSPSEIDRILSNKLV